MAPLVVDKEEEGEDSDDEACDDEHHHDQAAVHLPLLHRQANIKDTDKVLKDTNKDFRDAAVTRSSLLG